MKFIYSKNKRFIYVLLFFVLFLTVFNIYKIGGYSYKFYSVAHSQVLDYRLDLSTFLGGTGDDWVRDISFDSSGNIYVAGGSSSPYPPQVTKVISGTGSSDGTASDPTMDIFVGKFSPSGQLLWLTRIGGPNYDRAYALEVG
jgi:hypothetical protein